MTDKQIIIDGIDVSGCEYIIPPHEQCPNKPMPYAKETSCFACKEHNTKLNFCKNNPNCYYKQLKRKEQECEELKEEIKKHNDDMFKNPPEKRFYCKGCTLPYISKKLKQTLTEIKKLCRTGIVHGLSADEYATNLNILKFDILQKISEVEDV